MKKIVFVTQNKNKVIDAQNFLEGYKIEHVDFDVPEIQSLDSKEVAEFKVKYAYEKCNTPCFVWDVSLSFDGLKSFPGALIKWFFTKTIGASGICEIMKHIENKKLVWRTVLAYYDGVQTHYFEETVNGYAPDEPRGNNGYDWDVIFIPNSEHRTLAEMSYEEKAEFAVTKKLLIQFKKHLES